MAMAMLMLWPRFTRKLQQSKLVKTKKRQCKAMTSITIIALHPINKKKLRLHFCSYFIIQMMFLLVKQTTWIFILTQP